MCLTDETSCCVLSSIGKGKGVVAAEKQLEKIRVGCVCMTGIVKYLLQGE